MYRYMPFDIFQLQAAPDLKKIYQLGDGMSNNNPCAYPKIRKFFVTPVSTDEWIYKQ